MFSKITNSFKEKPSVFYSMSIAATWAGVGSLMVGMQTAQNFGIIPFLMWATGNTLACIVFGLLVHAVPKIRQVFRTVWMRYLFGTLCIMNLWVNLSGVQTIFAPTPLSEYFGMGLSFAFMVFFIALLIIRGMIRNVLTGHTSWAAVYAFGITVTIIAVIASRGNMVQLMPGLEPANLSMGLERFLLLLPGAFMYPFFYEIFDYNDQNPDGVKSIKIRRVFIAGGLLFGAYLTFTFLLAWTNFNPLLETLKAFFVSLVALSTVSGFVFSIYICFGRKLGIALNIIALAVWQLIIPMGFLGIWTAMATARTVVVLSMLAVAFYLTRRDKRKQVTV